MRVSLARALTLLAVGSTVAIHAQQQEPTFRAAVKLIDVDVVVTDREGNPVRDLTKDDFEIIEGGRRQIIQALSFIDLPVQDYDTRRLPDARFEPDITTNRGSEGRSYVFVLDDPGAEDLILRTKHLAKRFIDEVIQPDDQVAVIHAHGGFNDAQSFTSNRRLIIESIDRLRRRPIGPDGQNIDSLRTLKEVFDRLGTISGRRKAVIWMGPNIDLHPHAQLRVGQPAPLAVREMPLLLEAYREAIQAAANSNVAVYPLDPRGLTTDLGLNELVRFESLREVAADTGGIPLGVNTNNFSDLFAAVVRDASNYYLLGYAPDVSQDDGKFHPIEVRVRRNDVTVRARRGYYAPDPAKQKTGTPLSPLPPGLSDSAANALRRLVPLRDLGLDVTATPFKGLAREHPVAITANVRANDVRLEGTQGLALAYQVLDTEGRVVTGAYKVLKLELTAATRSAVADGGFRFTERVNLLPGRYELRLVVEQPGGKTGSVLTTVEVPEYKSAFQVSGIALASRDAAREVSLVDGTGLRDALGVSQTARRRFRAAEGLLAFMEVYADDPLTVSISGSITTTSGSVVTRADGQAVQAVMPTQPDDRRRRAYRITFRLPNKPGDYVVTVEARERDAGRPLLRHIPIVVD